MAWALSLPSIGRPWCSHLLSDVPHVLAVATAALLVPVDQSGGELCKPQAKLWPTRPQDSNSCAVSHLILPPKHPATEPGPPSPSEGIPDSRIPCHWNPVRVFLSASVALVAEEGQLLVRALLGLRGQPLQMKQQL